MRSHTKFGPDRFSRFDVYWIQTNKQTPKHPDKPNLYIDSAKQKYQSVIYPEVISTTEYVTIVPITDNKVDFSIRKNLDPENVS